MGNSLRFQLCPLFQLKPLYRRKIICLQEFRLNVQNLRTKPASFDDASEKQRMDIWTAELHRNQALLFSQIECIYQDFDAKIKDMAQQSRDISLRAQFMELYYFVLYQELLVLNQFEDPNKALLKSINAAQDKMKRNEDEIKVAKCKLKDQVGDDSLVSPNGKVIDMESLFRATGEEMKKICFGKRFEMKI